jgi:putative ABC transport system substrate-binding protein
MGGVARRQFLIALGALLAQAGAGAQTGRTYRVIHVNTAAAERETAQQAFVAAMRELGYVEGRNLAFEELSAERDASNLDKIVDRAIARKPDVLLAWESIAQVIRSKTTTLPIVLLGSLDPVKAGLAQSLARPGLNVTGFTQLNEQLPAKHMEILREILPRLTRVGQLVDRNASGCKVAEEHSRRAARGVGCELVPYYVTNRAEIESAFARMERDPPDALLPCPSTVLYSFRDVLFENVLRLRIPLTSYIVTRVPRGVLFAHAANIVDLYRRSAGYVDRILRGAKPGDLPIEQPTTFELVVNVGTAKALGLTVPQSILLRADRIVE